MEADEGNGVIQHGGTEDTEFRVLSMCWILLVATGGRVDVWIERNPDHERLENHVALVIGVPLYPTAQRATGPKGRLSPGLVRVTTSVRCGVDEAPAAHHDPALEIC